MVLFAYARSAKEKCGIATAVQYVCLCGHACRLLVMYTTTLRI